MTKKIESVHAITVNNKRYIYSVSPVDKEGLVFFQCKAAKISQHFLAEDIPNLLVNLPEFILDEINYQSKEKFVIRFRVSAEDKKKIMENALKRGYKSVSSFLRALALSE